MQKLNTKTIKGTKLFGTYVQTFNISMQNFEQYY